MVDFEKALEIIRERKPYVDQGLEYETSFMFSSKADEDHEGGYGHTALVVLKESGKIIPMYEFVLNGAGRIFREFDINDLVILQYKIEKMFEENYDSVYLKNPKAEGRRAFFKANGEVFCIDRVLSCLVIEHADSLECAERLTLEDGGLYYIGDYKDSREMFMDMLYEINN